MSIATRSRPPITTSAQPPSALGQLVLLTALFVVTLDFFIVNVALPSMRADLHAGEGAVTIWVAGFAIAFSAFLVLGSRLGDRSGRRRTFCRGLALFTGASAVCGFAPDPTWLAVGRILQGLGAALVSPQVLATLTATTDGPARQRAMTAYGLTAGLAAISGQLLGGALIALNLGGLDWRSCFLVNVPIGVGAIVLAGRAVPETRAERRLDIDPASVVLLAAALGALVLPLSEGRAHGWPSWCVALLALAGLFGAAFAARQRTLTRHGAHPLADARLLRSRAFGVGTALCLVLQTGIASSFFVLALALQGGLGLNPLDSGLVFTILAFGYVAASIGAPALETRLGPNLLLLGALLSAGGEALLALTGTVMRPGGSVAELAPGLLVAGIGMGLLFAPSVGATLAGVDPRRAGEASGILNTVQQAGGALGVALLGIVFYGALETGGAAHAFTVASWWLTGQAALVGLLALGLRTRSV